MNIDMVEFLTSKSASGDADAEKLLNLWVILMEQKKAREALVLRAINEAGVNGVTYRDLLRLKGIIKLKNELLPILRTLTDSRLISYVNVRQGKAGKGREAFFIL
jgi:hypothetical protein